MNEYDSKNRQIGIIKKTIDKKISDIDNKNGKFDIDDNFLNFLTKNSWIDKTVKINDNEISLGFENDNIFTIVKNGKTLKFHGIKKLNDEKVVLTHYFEDKPDELMILTRSDKKLRKIMIYNIESNKVDYFYNLG